MASLPTCSLSPSGDMANAVASVVATTTEKTGRSLVIFPSVAATPWRVALVGGCRHVWAVVSPCDSGEQPTMRPHVGSERLPSPSRDKRYCCARGGNASVAAAKVSSPPRSPVGNLSSRRISAIVLMACRADPGGSRILGEPVRGCRGCPVAREPQGGSPSLCPLGRLNTEPARF